MHSILIANRGEIALRIIRACKDAGLRSVAVYADPDADAPHMRAADLAFALPGSTAAETYLNIPALLEIARRSGADAVHPGYGFLSERAEFARAVQEAGLIWIGPAPEVIARLGDKVAARALARQVGAPLVPGTDGPVNSAAEIHDFARSHGLPVAIKAAFGGGGRGLKVARRLDEIEPMLAAARREAMAAFGDDTCYAERFLDRPRHVEAQVIADSHGTVLVLGTRDCSLQRRNQKLVEEAPAPFLADPQRHRIEEAAEAICREAGYTGAGTVEFLLGSDGMLSFLEVNTRLQVEHPVTEEVTGLDLVQEQFRIARGLPLSIDSAPAQRGHAIEFRINAEDPGRGFLPTPGRITEFVAPAGPGVRVDSGVESGSVVPGGFDSLMAKLIVTAPTRDMALARARRALAEFKITGPASTLPFHRALLDQPAFAGPSALEVHTSWIETEFSVDLAAALRVVPEDPVTLRGVLEIDGQRHDIGLGPAFLTRLATMIGGVNPPTGPAALPAPTTMPPAGAILAPLSGTVLKWLIEPGTQVSAGTPVAVMEAMKMEVPVPAPIAGLLRHDVEAGETVAAETPIGTIIAS